MTQQNQLADPELFRQAMRRWVAGVTIVTSAFEGQQHGMTVSSFTSISLTPPMILVSLERKTRTYELVSRSGVFAVTILSVAQEELSDRFAGRLGDEEDRLSGLATRTMVTGSPLIPGGLAFFDCRVVAHQDAGTSTVFFAEVLAAESADGDSLAKENPLVYSDRTYFRLQK